MNQLMHLGDDSYPKIKYAQKSSFYFKIFFLQFSLFYYQIRLKMPFKFFNIIHYDLIIFKYFFFNILTCIVIDIHHLIHNVNLLQIFFYLIFYFLLIINFLIFQYHHYLLNLCLFLFPFIIYLHHFKYIEQNLQNCKQQSTINKFFNQSYSLNNQSFLLQNQNKISFLYKVGSFHIIPQIVKQINYKYQYNYHQNFLNIFYIFLLIFYIIYIPKFLIWLKKHIFILHYLYFPSQNIIHYLLHHYLMKTRLLLRINYVLFHQIQIRCLMYIFSQYMMQDHIYQKNHMRNLQEDMFLHYYYLQQRKNANQQKNILLNANTHYFHNIHKLQFYHLENASFQLIFKDFVFRFYLQQQTINKLLKQKNYIQYLLNTYLFLIYLLLKCKHFLKKLPNYLILGNNLFVRFLRSPFQFYIHETLLDF
ncbi:hypothetical protein IMG5_001100 [Ichthyophthirius multifiliis]|uniref:Transmembrane protein n=1 Tax=Ichthyophthirius multifiliis TaxID=5932 RepID=G0QIQ1_ICHMU|nr:hypothetical protein IMG5_001100 [Ichthyophthirius multifiliis]EGR34880.1 hypothetical protein IMG5_001100 [Ichthyophthirius multifiliis]|eukprot:XP_004040184.1 hypothetical protein IMG5_001100 [Ichthyophthirius multifiliis]